MIILQKGNNSEFIYCTPKESSGTIYSFYEITFTNRITTDSVSVILEDLSTTARYQKLEIDTDSELGNYDTGFWKYDIKGSEDGENVDELILESGFMYLYPENAFAPTKYNEQNNQFLTYNG